MKLMNRLERKFGKYAISNLSLYIIICYILGYIFQLFAPQVFELFVLSPYHICHGQIWRLITWVLMPPSSLGIFTIIMLIFYYSVGTSLERTIGSFRYNVFIFGGIIMTAIAMIVGFWIYILLNDLTGEGLSTLSLFFGYSTSTYYLSTAIFLAYALFYPDAHVLLYYVIPVRVRWIAILDLVFMLYDFVKGGIGVKIVIGAALLNLIIFFLAIGRMKHMTPGEIKRRKSFAKEVRQATPITRHKCAVCGRTEKDGDDLVFRFCTKCNGNYEYCQDHMFTHEHVK